MGGLGGAESEPANAVAPKDTCDNACATGETCCQGTCAHLEEDAEHCGACHAACSQAGGVGTCEEGQCSIACAEGQLDCDGLAKNGCEADDPGPPEGVALLRPLLGAATGSLITAEKTGALRPTFTWTPAPPGACEEVAYQIQVDDSCPVEGFADCAFESPELDELVEGAMFTPSDDLPVSHEVPVGTRYVWRVRACDPLERCSEWSVGYVDVGRDRQDITGDGYPDILLKSETDADDPYVFLHGAPDLGVGADGAPADIAAPFSFDQSGTTGGFWNHNPPVIRFVGDVNGDGFQDFVADGESKNVYLPPDGERSLEELISCPTRLLYLGAETFAGIQAVTFSTSTWAPGSLSHNFAAGDFDRDGYADVWAAQSAEFSLGDASTPNHEPRVFLFQGRSDVGTLPPPDTSGSPTANFSGVWRPSSVIEPRPDDNGDLLGISVEPGDFNGDGHVDAAVVAPEAHLVYVVLGGGDATWVARAIPYGGPDVGPTHCRDVRLSVADLNGDGFDDFALNCDQQHRIEGYFGGDPLPDALAFSELGQLHVERSLLDTLTADLDGDGRVELITGNTYGNTQVEMARVWVFPGTSFHEQAFAPEPLPLFGAETSFASRGYFGAADHNGDGFTDLVLTGNPTSWVPGNGSLDFTEEGADGRVPVTPRVISGIVGAINSSSVGR
jgi:hypothetical protein